MPQNPIFHAWEARVELQKARGRDVPCHTAAEVRELAILAVLEWVVDELARKADRGED
jgi:hypothetical protein